MTEINKHNIPQNYKWFSDKLDPNFKLVLGEKSKVIFGFNGIGKSTLCSIIRELHIPTIDFLSYEQQEKDKLIKESELKLSYKIEKITQLDNEIRQIESQLDANKFLKNNGISNSSIRTSVNPELEEYTKCFLTEFKSSTTEIHNFFNKFPNINLKSFFPMFPEFKTVSEAEKEFENEQKEKLFEGLTIIKDSVNREEKTCPVCGTNSDWFNALIKKIEELSKIKSKLLDKYKTKKLPSPTIEELNIQLEAYKLLRSNQNLAFDLAFVSNEEEYKTLTNKLSYLKQKNEERKSLLSVAEEKFKLVLNKKEYLENDLKRYFNINSDSIEYDEQNFVINISFPRKIETYSTGEINLVTFLYGIYSFLGSDKDTLILDDPVSSLDMINQYKIAFEIVNNCSENKYMVVFTHSTDFINILNSQYEGKFDYFYLEQVSNLIYLDKIEYVNNKNPNIISLGKIKDYDNQGLIDYIINRDSNQDDNFSIFHYSIEECSTDDKKLSNHQLIELIDRFNGFTHMNFYKNSYNKIKYLVAVRVWIEKKLFNLINSLNQKEQDKFFKKQTLQQRILFVMGENGYIQINGKIVYKEQLMSKKVMLNQNVHFNSQVAPLSYAINLSLDDLQAEILDIKNLFV